MLVYKDFSDDEDALNQIIDGEGDEEEGEYESEEDDEEIEQIQIGKKQKVDDEYGDYDDEMALDDSVSSDQEDKKRQKRIKKEIDEQQDYGDYDSEEEDETEMRKRLV